MDSRTPDLLERFLQGDATAYETLVGRYDGPLRRFVQAHLSASLANLVGVDDVLQEVHLQALRDVAGFEYRRELSFFFWLCAIARNRIRAHGRRVGRRPPLVSLHAGSPEATGSSAHLLACLQGASRSPSQVLAHQQETEVLALALAELPERRRTALLLRHVEGLDGPECARRMGMSHGAFRVLASRALAELRRVLDRTIGAGGEGSGP